MSLSAVGGAAWSLLPSRCRHPANAHHQGAIRLDGPADRQRVHVLREKGLVGKSVADAAVIQYLKGRRGRKTSKDEAGETVVKSEGDNDRAGKGRGAAEGEKSRRARRRCEG